MKILVIGDIADNMVILKKFSKHEIQIFNFPRKQAELFTLSTDGVEFFDSLSILKQVNKINQIKNKFDICLVLSWAAARIAYLAGLNYSMYFLGGDITTPPFIKKSKSQYLKNPVNERNFFERWFYKQVFKTSRYCIAPFEEYFEPLKKFRKDAIRMDRIFVDTTIFKDNIIPVNQNKEKFTFLAPQKMGIEKGYDVIWKALELTKSDFHILQVKWFTERNNEEKEFNDRLIKKMPEQIKLIPLIKRKDMPKYYAFADAILGQMRVGVQGGIERDAAFCKKPILCYTDPLKPLIIDREKKIPPFLPSSRDPKELAMLIDKIVESKEFRDNLAEQENKWVREIFDPKKVTEDWEIIFNKIKNEFPSINRKQDFKMKIVFKISSLFEKYYYKNKMKEKNMKAWGKEEYEKLMK